MEKNNNTTSNKNPIDNYKTIIENDLKLDSVTSKFRIHCNEELFKKHYPTGYKNLDYALFGGFTPGLHILGAISSLGKSTFALNIADNLASAGYYVIFTSLEMSRTDLYAKSISRHLFEMTTVNSPSAKTSNEILSPKTKDFTEIDWEYYDRALTEVSDAAKNIIVLENQIQPINVAQIRSQIDKFIKAYEQKPFVIIDYFQILGNSQSDKYIGDRQAVEQKIIELRSIAVTYDIPILVISSFNRENYGTKANMSAFKETGMIEYSADTLIALQFKGVEDQGFNPDIAKTKNPREIELKILKQRYGESGVTINYDYYAKYNCFKEKNRVLEQTIPVVTV